MAPLLREKTLMCEKGLPENTHQVRHKAAESMRAVSENCRVGLRPLGLCSSRSLQNHHFGICRHAGPTDCEQSALGAAPRGVIALSITAIQNERK